MDIIVQIERLRERPTFIDQVNAALAAHQQGEPGIPGEPVVKDMKTMMLPNGIRGLPTDI